MQPFVDAAEKLKEEYKHASSECEQAPRSVPKADTSSIIKSPDSGAAIKIAKPSRAGFTAVKASPLAVNLDFPSSEDNAQDEVTVAVNLGGSQPHSTFPSKRHRREGTKEDSQSRKKDAKAGAKSKGKEEKGKRRKDHH
jgi:hypothetical protein